MDKSNISALKSKHIGIIGGGIAGSTIALKLSELGIKVTLFEEGSSLVNGPPICHLHAGGNLYREISDEQCLTLLQQSIDTVKIYPHCVNARPTVIIIPQRDKGSICALLPRLKKLKQKYQSLVTQDPRNKVLGEVDEYFQLFDEQEFRALASCATPTKPVTPTDWMIPVAKNVNLEEIKFPVLMVQEYGLNLFRIAATATLALHALENCTVLTQSKVTEAKERTDKGWDITHITDQTTQHTQVDILINACGYQSGKIDDMAAIARQRMVEFKAAYVTKWPLLEGTWPEVIFHGERGTPNGMAQLTPYADGYFQLHGMTDDITLFPNGIAKSTKQSAQPTLQSHFIKKIRSGWDHDEIELRTRRAIAHLAQFVPAFNSAKPAGRPLFGAQQVPGDDISLRASDVSFVNDDYIRAEIVKASSAIAVAEAIVKRFGITDSSEPNSTTLSPEKIGYSSQDVTELAMELATERKYPASLAKQSPMPETSNTD